MGTCNSAVKQKKDKSSISQENFNNLLQLQQQIKVLDAQLGQEYVDNLNQPPVHIYNESQIHKELLNLRLFNSEQYQYATKFHYIFSNYIITYRAVDIGILDNENNNLKFLSKISELTISVHTSKISNIPLSSNLIECIEDGINIIHKGYKQEAISIKAAKVQKMFSKQILAGDISLGIAKALIKICQNSIQNIQKINNQNLENEYALLKDKLPELFDKYSEVKNIYQDDASKSAFCDSLIFINYCICNDKVLAKDNSSAFDNNIVDSFSSIAGESMYSTDYNHL